MDDLQEAFDAGFDAVKAYVDSSFAAFEKRIVALEQCPAPRDGKDADPSAIAAIIADNFRKDFDELRATVDALPKKAHELPDIPAIVAKAVEVAMPAPADVKALVADAVAALPPAKDGKDGAKGDTGEIGPAGQPGLNGKDGTDLVGTLMIDRKGALIHTLADGSMRDLGIVVGKDVDMDTVKTMIDEATHAAIYEAVSLIPKPKDGERGPQGEPGKSISIDDVAPLIETAVAKHVQSVEKSVPDLVKTAVSAIKVPEAPQLPDIPAMVDAAVKALPPAQDGKDADPALVASMVAETVERAVAALPVAKDGQDGVAGADGRDGRDGLNGQDGKSVTIDDVRPLIEESVTKAVTLIPVPRDGVDGKKGEPGIDGKDGAAGRDGINGKDAPTMEELRPLIDESVSKAVAVIPVPKDGKDGAPGLNGKDGTDGLNGKDGRDGLDVKDLLVVEGGELVATFTDGRTKVLGQFRGKDGDPGKDGSDGRNGADAIGFDDLTEELEDDGRIIVRQFFHAGQMVKETRITTKTPIFRGVHDHARTYLPGDMVTRGGSVWHCDVECQGPFNGDHFTLSAKKGRDAKAAD